APTYVASRLRVRIGQQGSRHSRLAGLSGSSEYSAHGALHRAVARSLQGFLEIVAVQNDGLRAPAGYDGLVLRVFQEEHPGCSDRPKHGRGPAPPGPAFSARRCRILLVLAAC